MEQISRQLVDALVLPNNVLQNIAQHTIGDSQANIHNYCTASQSVNRQQQQLALSAVTIECYDVTCTERHARDYCAIKLVLIFLM